MTEHDGHRQRMKKRFTEYGLDSFDDHNVLELLLFYALPRVDTNAVAHKLINHFGSLSAVLDASIEELKAVAGIGESAATLLKLVPAVNARYMACKNAPGDILATSAAAGSFLIPRFANARDETVLLLCLDAKFKLVSVHQVGKGDVTSAHISVRKVAEIALMQNVPNVVLAHNHVDGFALPSTEDLAATRMLQQALAAVGVNLIDHIVVAGDDFVSLRDNGDIHIHCSDGIRMQD